MSNDAVQNIAQARIDTVKTSFFIAGLNNVLSIRNSLVFFLLVALVCVFAPFFIFHLYEGSYVAYGNESLAYRYFTTYRLMSGEAGLIWLPQGFFTLVLQKIILLVQNLFIPPYESFRSSLELFGTFTNIFQGLLALSLLLAIFRDKYLTSFFKWLPLLFIAILTYGTNNRGFYYSLVPDYYQLDIILLTSSIYFFFCIAARNTKEISLSLIAIIGFISGLAISNKVSLLFPVIAPFFLLVTKHRKEYKKLSVLLLTAGLTFLVGFFLPLLFIYAKNERLILLNYPRWLAFIASPGSESDFLNNLKAIYLSGDNYVQYTLSYVFVWVLVFINLIRTYRTSHNFLAYLGLFCLTSLSFILPLKVHSAGTTNFEVFGSITALTFMLFALVSKDSLIQRFKFTLIFFWAYLLSPMVGFQSLAHEASHSKINSDIFWEAHNALLSPGKPMIMILPDNSYGVGGVEELLLKGLSEFPSWNITSGKNLLDKFAPALSFLSDYSEARPELANLKNPAIMWIDKKEEPSLKIKYPALSVKLSQGDYHCRTWTINDARIINVCNNV